MRRRHAVAHLANWTAAVLGAALLLFLAVPILLLVVLGAAGVPSALHDRETLRALEITFIAATTATTIAALCGTPIAYALSRRNFRARTVFAAVIDLPLLIPHPVAGIAILLLVSRNTAFGSALIDMGVRVVGSPAGIVAAMLFVSAPLFVSGAREAFSRVDRRYEFVGRTLGDTAWTAFRRVTLPLARRGLASAAIVTWARSVSEFGAVVVLAYNPKVVSVLSYERFTTGGLRDALPIAATLVLVSLVPLIALRALRYERSGEAMS
ncbi:MAG: ABC transporter permease [Gemmatimonadota bacterium]|nr:ABC transporter permease [Gemmatimonadota bacterium]